MKAMQRLEAASPATPLATALLELELVRDLGGWRRVGTLPGPLPTVPPTDVVSPEVDVAPEMPRRTTLPEPVSLRQRLVQSGDLPATASAGAEMDAALTEAVWRFQLRNGLLADGVVGARTLAALNAPVADADRAGTAQPRPRHARPIGLCPLCRGQRSGLRASRRRPW